MSEQCRRKAYSATARHCSTHAQALALARDHSLSIYDALVVASALEAACDTLYSEDLQNGRRFPALTIVNPFAT